MGRKTLRTFAWAGLAFTLLGGIVAGELEAQDGPAALAGQDGFGVRSADGAFALRVRGIVQVDGRFFLEDTLSTLTNQFQLRRVRPDIQGTLFRDFDFRIYFDLAGSQVELLDAYGNIRFVPEVQLRVGKMKGPVGLERLQSPPAMFFAERALPTSLAPNRDIGAQLHGTISGGLAEYAIGIFNGVADGGSADSDTGDSKDLNARLFLTPLRGTGAGPLEGLSVGVAVSHGDQNGSVGSPSLAAYRTGGREVFFRYRADGTADGTTVARGRRTRISPQATWYWRNLGAIGEYVQSEQTLVIGADTARLTNTAWQAAGSIVLTGETTSFRGIVPRRPLNVANGDWGAIELVGRVNVLEIDPDAFPTFANPAQAARKATAYAGGINWYLNRALRLLVNYERTSFEAAAGATERPTENVLITRVQVAF